ncbi:MAG TPA: tetratricopeptide repeat protein, partial [Polyangiaceae bacterium]|nr:tetratricopeptide repeat protein [Polyangiaceae bacterium]
MAYEALETAFELDPEDEKTVAELEKMASATRRWPKLVELVNARIERETDPRAQLSLCRRLAKWYDVDLDREHYAEPYYRRVLALDPHDVGAARKLADCCERRGDWRERGRILESALEVASTPADRAAVLTDLGELYERHVDAEQGLARYQRAFAIARDYAPVLVHLERVYQDCNMTEPLIEVLRAIAECSDEKEAVAINLRIGRLLESTVQRVEAAIDVYRNVLGTEPGNALAIQGLGRCFTATRNWPALREVLNMRLDCAQSERERVAVLIDIAVLEDEQFLQTERAAQRLERALEIDGHNERAYQLLARAYRKLRQWHALVASLQRHIAAMSERHQTIPLYLQIAEIQERELSDHEGAITAYAAVVAIDGDHLEAQQALAKLHEATGDTESAIASMSRALELVSDNAQRVATLYRIGHLHEERLEDRAGASEHFRQALDLDPTYVPALAALRVIAIEEEDWQRAAHYLDEEQQHTSAPRKRAQLLVELGRLRAEKLDEPARDAYELAHACDPNNDEATWRLARCYVEEGAWEEAEPLTELLMRKAKQRDERVQRSLLHARVQGAVGNTAGALDAYETARDLDATNREAIRGLAGASFECRDWGRARKSYLEVLSSLHPEDVRERADIYYRLGSLEREDGQEHAAIHYFEKALAIEPRHRATLKAMIAIHDRIG